MPNSAAITHSTIKAAVSKEKKNPFAVAIVKLKAAKQAKKVISALAEVKKIQEGKKAPKSFDAFLNEL